MTEEQINEQISRILEAIDEHDYGDEGMNQLQKQLHSLLDMKNKLKQKRTFKEWLWDNSKPLVGGAFTLITTVIVVGNEHTGPILSKAFGFISKPKI